MASEAPAAHVHAAPSATPTAMAASAAARWGAYFPVMTTNYEITPDGIPYEYTVHRQDLDEGRAIAADAAPFIKAATLMALDVPGEPLMQKTVSTVPAAERLHEALTDPRSQDKSE